MKELIEELNVVRQVRQSVCEEWTRLEIGWVKVNYDGAFSKGSSKDMERSVGIGIIIRDEAGEVLCIWFIIYI